MQQKLDLKAALKELGSKIRAARLRAGLTQEEFAEKCDISVSFVSMLERGERGPSFETVLVVAQVLGLPPADFFPGPPGEQSKVARVAHFVHQRGLTEEGVEKLLAIANAAFPAPKGAESASVSA